MNLDHFCLTVNNSLDSSICDELIQFFNSNSSYHERYQNNLSPQFTQLHFTKYRTLNPDLHRRCEQAAINAIELYSSKIDETKFWPLRYGFEQFRIKHYLNNGSDQFAPHIDAANLDSMKRFLAFFWYLNDVEEGGETKFLNLDLTIKPKKGTLFIFPPLWLYPHQGNPTVSGEKYLLSSYLHFIE